MREASFAAAILAEETPTRDALRNAMVVLRIVEDADDGCKEGVYNVMDDDGTAMNLSTTRRRMPGDGAGQSEQSELIIRLGASKT